MGYEPNPSCRLVRFIILTGRSDPEFKFETLWDSMCVQEFGFWEAFPFFHTQLQFICSTNCWLTRPHLCSIISSYPPNRCSPTQCQTAGFHYDESYLIWLGFHFCLWSTGTCAVNVTLHSSPSMNSSEVILVTTQYCTLVPLIEKLYIIYLY